MNREQHLGTRPANLGRFFPRARVLLACLASALLLSSTIAWAEPIRIVTAGGPYQLVEDGETGMTLVGSDFVLSVDSVYWTPVSLCSPCTAGTSANLSGTVSPRLFPAGTATIDGTAYESVYFAGLLYFDAGSVTVPNVPVGSHGARPITTFTASGTLSGYADSSLAGAPLFSMRLTGTGLASVGFFNYPSSAGVITRDGFSYEFQETVPTPEPGSMLLFGSGAAWMVSRLRRRSPSR